MASDVVIKVHRLKKYFELKKGFFSLGAERLYVKALDDVDFVIREGEILGLVGESGCGKTTTGRLLTRLEDPTSGSVFFLGRDIALLEGEDLKVFRRNIQMVFQDPYESLNPRTTVLQTVMEPLVNHNIGSSFEERVVLVTRALEDAGLAPAKEYLARFPHELSGGQRQRVSIARALVMKPRVIVADEPVSMLDVSIRAGVLNLMLDLRDKYRIPYLFITHDIAVARYVSDRLAVMYLGKIVELAETDEVIFKSKHPYTQALLSAVPVPDPEHKHGRITIKGEIPSAIDVPLGCRFRPRCPKAFEECGWQGTELAEWLLEEENVQEEQHPMYQHIDQLKPDGFSIMLTIKPGGSPEKVKQFLEGKREELKGKKPMLGAVKAVETGLGNRELRIKCSAANLTGEQVAQELLELLEETVEYRSPDHPLHGTILDAVRSGSDVVLTVGFEGGPGSAKLDSTVKFMRDFLSHYSKRGYPEFSGTRNVDANKSTRKVVAHCRSGKMPAVRVAKLVAQLVEREFEKEWEASGMHIMPVKALKNTVIVRTLGTERAWEKLQPALAAFLKEAEKQTPAAAAVSGMSVRITKGATDIVGVKFKTVEEPPLVDLGGGHLVACYLWKSQAA